MAQLIFKGPFHFSQLKSLQLKGKAGIYIWGFAYDLDKNGQLNELIDFSKGNIFVPPVCLNESKESIGCDLKSLNWEFIPYYVGLDDKLFNRINNHHAITTGDRRKYTRMNFKRYKDFYYSGSFPIFIKGQGAKQRRDLLNLIIDKNNPIDYFNNYFIMREIHSDLNLSKCLGLKELWNDLPIDICNWEKKQDTLSIIVNNKNNFWFSYAELDPVTESIYLKEKQKHSRTTFLEFPEAQTFYSLKGITISETLEFQKINQNQFGINYTIHTANNSCKNIFKLDSNGNIIADENFPGYL
jgi:hypothetical protein